MITDYCANFGVKPPRARRELRLLVEREVLTARRAPAKRGTRLIYRKAAQ